MDGMKIHLAVLRVLLFKTGWNKRPQRARRGSVIFPQITPIYTD